MDIRARYRHCAIQLHSNTSPRMGLGVDRIFDLFEAIIRGEREETGCIGPNESAGHSSNGPSVSCKLCFWGGKERGSSKQTSLLCIFSRHTWLKAIFERNRGGRTRRPADWIRSSCLSLRSAKGAINRSQKQETDYGCFNSSEELSRTT